MDITLAQDVVTQTTDAASQSAYLFSSKELPWLVAIGAAISTFVASVMAEEQQQRLRNGVFGSLAGGAAGALLALITKQDSLIVIGLLGSAVGALLGWIACLLLSWAATSRIGRTVLEYQVGGWKGVRERLNLEGDQPLLLALDEWGQNFVRLVNQQKEEIQAMASSTQANAYIKLVLRNWMVSYVDMLGLLFGLAKKPRYKSRVTIIVFGEKAGKPQGLHWISNAGQLDSHKHHRPFDDKSVGYQVLCGGLSSPYFTTSDVAKQKGQDRDQQSYRPFLTFRISNKAIVAIDWPNDLSHEDQFVMKTQNLFHLDLGPAVQTLLQRWTGNLEAEVGLQPLPTASVTTSSVPTPSPAPLPIPSP